MLPPSHSFRGPEKIVGENVYFDSSGYLYRAMSWIDHFERHDQFAALHYACIDARLGIEYLIFEEIAISTGANLSSEQYEECLKSPTKLYKALMRISPDYEMLQSFVKILMSLEPNLPNIIYWQPRKLLKSWGRLSKYLHWFGSKNKTTNLKDWRANAGRNIRELVEPVWEKISSGQSAIMHPRNMNPEIHELWIQYQNGEVDSEGIRIRMEILKPLLESMYASQAK